MSLLVALLSQTSGLTLPGSLGVWEYLGRIVFVILMFVAVAFAAYYTTRFIASSKLKTGLGLNIKIVESAAVGTQANIQLVCVAGKYVLIGVTKERITFLTEISGDGINVSETARTFLPFESYLNKVFNRKTDAQEQEGDSEK